MTGPGQCSQGHALTTDTPERVLKATSQTLLLGKQASVTPKWAFAPSESVGSTLEKTWAANCALCICELGVFHASIWNHLK